MYSKVLNYPTASSTTSAHSRFMAGSSAVASTSASTSSSLFNYDNLRLDDILCPVCQSVLVEPVFLPCQHLFCRNCIRGTIEKNNLYCPCCRKRFGTWYRNASRANELVHEQLWRAIQSQFREHLYEDNPSGSTKGSKMQQVKSLYSGPSNPTIHLANPGEIQKEFKDELKRYQKELLEEKAKELTASDQFIINMYKQEGIVDLADTSSHVSVSSATTPDLQDGHGSGAAGSHITANVSSMAGPSKVRTQPHSRHNQQGKAGATTGLRNCTSPSTASVISISSTSSAASGVTASSCLTSPTSDRYSLIKSVAQKVGRTAEIVKQKVQDTILHRLTSGKLQQHQRSLNALDLNTSDLCIKPTAVHKAEHRGAEGDDNEVNDTDSLKSEQNHFIPIVQSLPKSSTFRRVLAVRPVPIALQHVTTPKKSPYQPLKPGRPLSAFKVVKLQVLTPTRYISTEIKKETSPSPGNVSQRGARRGRQKKLTFSTPKKSPKQPAQSRRMNLKDIIVSDQQRREQQIEMERRDFEFAQKLQQKLNRSSGIMQEIQRQPRSTGYSLRRKRPANCDDLATHELLDISSSSSNSSTVFNRTVDLTLDTSNAQKTPAQAARKRKATSSSVENDIPSSSSPAKRANASAKTRRLTRQTRTKYVDDTSLLEQPEEPQTPCPVPQRKSTRNKTR